MSKCPTFKYSGSKAFLAPWVVGILPKTCRKYVEPFAGRGNIFYRYIHSGGKAQRYILNDKFNSDWLTAVKIYDGDWGFVDDYPIDRNTFNRWLHSAESLERTIAACWVSYQGNRYRGIDGRVLGCNVTGSSGNRHSKKHTIQRLKSAQAYLKRSEIYGMDYLRLLKRIRFAPEDLVYIDPPYNVKYEAWYPNIDHSKLIWIAKSLKCRVAISGYFSHLYDDQLLNWNIHTKKRASRAKCTNSSSGDDIVKVEYLWTNF